jgi:hypothetical protein
MNVKDTKARSKALLAGAGVLATAGLGIAAATASPPVPGTTQSPVGTQSITADTPTPGDAADMRGTVEGPETADAQDPPGDPGPDVEQTGEHTDPGDAPGSP